MFMENPSRREFLKSSLTVACSTSLGVCGAAELLTASPASSGVAPAPSPAPLPIKKGVLLDMLPAKLSYADRMKMARDVGFEVVQAPTTPDEHEAEEIRKAADGASVRIDPVMNMDHWQYPLSSSDPAVVEKTLELGVVRCRECAAVRLSARLQSHVGEEHRQGPPKRLQAQGKWLRVGKPRRRRCGLGSRARSLPPNRLCGKRHYRAESRGRGLPPRREPPRRPPGPWPDVERGSSLQRRCHGVRTQRTDHAT